ncbi:MAG TPA: ABC transporter permease [Chthoniobacterales bacterium]|jgi:putative ABC transport system permease protein|nr:ABC transporter permease [Chthoniobacterales bacterium]
MNTLFADLRYGIRMLMKNPGFTFAALLTLALGIASSTAIFSVIDGVLLHPLPYPDSEKLMVLSPTTRSTGVAQGAFSPANYIDYAAQNDVFTHLGASRGEQFSLSDGDRPERVRGTMTTSNMFPLFDVTPILGRALQPSDEQPGHNLVVVLSSELWARRFASDRNIIGRQISLNDEPHTVVGVMPPNYMPDNYGELWVPSAFGVPTNSLRPNVDPRPIRGSNYLDVFARLKPGVTLEKARAELDAISRRLEQQYSNDNRDLGVKVTPLHEDVVGGLRPVLLLLFAAVGFLVFIGCANVANLLLARAATRSREISIRAAMGASRARLIRQLLTESVLLAVIGGAIGAVLAAWAIPLLMAMAPPALRSFKDIGLNGQVLAFSAGISVVTGILFGLVPAISSATSSPAESLKQGERGSTGTGNRRRGFLIATEVGLSLVLLIGAGLMIKSFSNLTKVTPGFNPDRLLIFSVGASAKADEDRQLQFYQQVLQQTAAVPGVEHVAAVSRLPFSGGNSARSFNRPGSTKEDEADIRVATPDYFKTMGIPFVRGRNFTDHDTKDSARVAIINEQCAKDVFPGEDPIGQFVENYGPNNEKLQVVGVVGNVRHRALEHAPRPELYQPLGQGMWPSVFIAVRTAPENPLTVLPGVQQAVWSVNKSVPLGNPRTMNDLIARTLLQKKFTVLLLSIFAGAALVLAAIGLYGVISYSVAQRTRELGIRIALGAQKSDVLRLILRQGMTLVAAGVVFGIAASLGLTRLIASLLYGISASDPLTFFLLSAALVLVAFIACWLPARRASAVDPIVALHAE